MKKKEVFIIIPAYNEEKILESIISNIRKENFSNIIVVDDGSTDRTYQKAKKCNVIVLRHSLNRGKGAAIKTGMEAAKLLNAHIVVTIDGDGQHNPEDIHNMLNILRQGYDVVLGTRMAEIKSMPFIKRIMNYSANAILWILYGIWVSDSQCGLRLYSKKALYSIDTIHDQYEYDSEIIRELKQKKLTYTETPIKTLYTSYSMNKKKKQTLEGGIKTLMRLVLSI